MSDWFTEKGTIGDLPRRAADRFGDREAIVFGDGRWTFEQVADDVDETARALIALGVKPGEKIAVWLVNSPEWILLLYAITKVGAILVPLNTRFRADDVEFVVHHSDATTLVQNDVSGPIDFLEMTRSLLPELGVGGDGAANAPQMPALDRVITIGAARPPGALWWPDVRARAAEVSADALAERAGAVDPDATALVLYTSGTTGFPKGVMHSHRAIRALIDRANRLGVTPRDTFLCNLPLFHLYGLSEMAMMSPLTGSKLVLTEGFDPDESVRLIERERVTMIHGFDVHYSGLMEARDRLGADVSSLRVGSIPAGMDSTAPVAKRVVADFCPVVSAYGLTEGWACGAIGFLDDDVSQRSEASGYPMPGYEFKIVDGDSGGEVPNGTEGEIVLRSYMVMQGYYKQPEITAETIDEDGWLHTGDMGIIRDDGHVRLIGRYKDMLKVGGENVSPMEVERYLLERHPVALVAIVGHPHDGLDEIPVAFVVASNEHDGTDDDLAEAMIESCRGRIASFKIPRHVIVIDAMPMTASGKIRKHELRGRVSAALAGRAPGT